MKGLGIELGAGQRTQPGFVAVDVNPAHAQVVADARRLPFATGTVGFVRAVDVLEHISYRDVEAALREWARVLVPGGGLYVQVPAADVIMRWFAADDVRLQRWEHGKACTTMWGAQWRLLGGHADGVYVGDEGDFRWNAHFSMWGFDELTAALIDSTFGIDSMQYNEHPNILAYATRR